MMASSYAMASTSNAPSQVDAAQMNTFRSYVTILGDPNAKDELKLKAAQELSEHFEEITQCSGYQSFLEHSMKIFIKILQDGEPNFISEFSLQQIRKLVLEMIHRLPTSETLRPYAKPILTLMLKLLQSDNEENVMVCLRIIIEFHKQYRPPYNPEIQHFLAIVKGIYTDLPKHLPKIFEPRVPIRVKDLKELNFDQLLGETYTMTPIQVEKKTNDGATITYNLIPKGILSLKVLQELPIIVVLIYQIYKQSVNQEVTDFVPLIMTTITLQPSPAQRASPSFNKEIFVDFMGAQIKTLSFLAYIIRFFQEIINNHAQNMIKGMLSLLQLCPKEVTHLRKELLVAARHILATDLRHKFVICVDKLFDEDLLLGRGYTAYESLRALAYSTLADLVHHVRQQLSLDVSAKAIILFSKNVHDDTLTANIQTMSCKLLLNLVDCIRQQYEIKPDYARELLITLLKVFTQKFYTIAKIHLPMIMSKWRALKADATPGNSTPNPATNTPLLQSQTSVVSDTLVKGEAFGFDFSSSEQQSKLQSIGFAPPINLNVGELRGLVKTLVCGVKTITWGCSTCKSNSVPPMEASVAKAFEPHEVAVFIDLVKWGLEALDIYQINQGPLGGSLAQLNKSSSQIPRSKEEKEVLEHFSGVFHLMNNQNFQEIFASTIDFMVERIHKNPSLQIIANSFLANPQTSPLFATVLVEYLLERMEEMGSNIDRSNLYLRLFKLVFGSVSLFPTENEHMLRPHLHNIVNRSMELAMTAKEPYNYFLLLRALFRSIGGGSHDLLYQEFLPLLPNLLEGLNRLQSGFHKQHMKDLFIELCLTVPVRLSSLLPYLPMLMDPLVSALNGSPTLISQGLRTLELCVDNLQPDFLYDHIQPVRADLMQALWRTLRNHDSAALVAFRLLGKLGGGNRKMMIEPQKLEYHEYDTPSPGVIAYFQDHSKAIDFPVDKVIETAFSALKSSSTDPFYWRQSWEVIRCYLASSLSLDDDKHTLQKLFMHPSFTEGNIGTMSGPQYRSQDVQARQTHQTALTGMFVAAATKELRQSVLPTMVAVVRHYTMVAIAQQAGPFPHKHYQQISNGLDPLVLIDALAAIMGHEEKELCKPGHLAMALVLETATNIMGNKERACRLPMMQYLAEKMSSLCYERPWYAKMGGCIALKFFYEHMAMRWLYQHLFSFLKAFIFVIMDLDGEVSSGAIDSAKTNLEKMLRICMVPLDRECKNEELIQTQNKAMYEVIHELVRQVTSPHTLVREQAIASLKLIAELQNKTVTEVMEPHREVLVDMMPPKKHLLRHQPVSAQIGIMDGNTFCTTLEPRLFTLDVSIITHKVFFHEVLTLCEAEDVILHKFDCYKNATTLIPLRKSALRALAACHYITQIGAREKIFQSLVKSLEKNNFELQEAAFECMQKFIAGYPIDKDIVHSGMRPLLLTLGDYRNLSLNGAKRLSYLTQLFPSMFNEKLCEQLLQHIKKMLEISAATNKGKNYLAVAKTGEIEQKITTIIGIFHQIPAATSKFIDSLCRLILQLEDTLWIEPSCPYRDPLVKFLIRYPKETLDLFLHDNNVKNPQWNRFTIYLLSHKNGAVFRSTMETKPARLIQLIRRNSVESSPTSVQQSSNQITREEKERYESQHQAVLIIHTLTEFDDQWLATQSEIVGALKTIWNNDLYKSCESNVACDLWHLVAKILLHYFSHHTNDIDLLFQLLRALCYRFVPDFQFLKDFLQNTVAQGYTVDWKRKAFFHFVENFNNPNISQDLKAKILTAVLIPCFAVSFEKGEGNKLIGAAPSPFQEDDNSVVSVFINKIIDPDKPFANEDAVRIALLQLACLFVERASPHIHDGDASNKRQGDKLRRLMTFAWPCLLGKNCVDPSARYHGHLLLSHIIARLAIHKRIVLQVFHSLLKGHAADARGVVRQALEVLTPAMPVRMEDGNTMLKHWTKKIIVEEGHTMQQLYHILQLVVRHYKVYYPVRHHLVHHMVNSIQRLGFSPTSTLEHRKLAVELAEVIIKWEIQRIREENDGAYDEDENNLLHGDMKASSSGLKRTMPEDNIEARKKFAAGENSPQAIASGSSHQQIGNKIEGSARPIDRTHCDTVLNFLFRLACQINDPNSNAVQGIISAADNLVRRCVTLIKMAMKPDVWPQPCDLKLGWLDKLLGSLEQPTPNFGNICTGLELLTFLLTVMKREHILLIFRPLQRGLSVCVTATNTRIIRLMHGLLSRLMLIFPTDSYNKHEELETLYGTVSKMIFEGLANYEKSQQANPTSLFGTLMILKAACMNNQSYIDRLMMPFMKLLNRLHREHLTNSSNTASNVGMQPDGSGPVALELLTLSLDLVKNRVVVMGVDMRKLFIGGILVGLIEKTSDVKVMKAIVKMIEDWMKNKSTPTVTQAPTLREKSILLVKLMQYVEKRFPDEQDLNAQFLELINYIYRDDQLKQSELTSKLEAAFLAGLRCNQPHIRAKFFEIFDGSMRRRLHDRLLYIICSHAWDSIGHHYWIKQCIELLILTANTTTQIQNANEPHLLPSISSVINLADSDEKKNFVIYTSMQNDPTDAFDPLEDKEDAFDMEMCVDPSVSRREESERPVTNRCDVLTKLISRQAEFLEASRKIKTEQLLVATAQLCHMDTHLAEKVWIEVFPRLWGILDEGQQQAIEREIIQFLSSGTHVIQKDCHPSALNTFIEALSQCHPPIYLPPDLMTYLGKAHNLWHRMTLTLERMALETPNKRESPFEYSDPDNNSTESDQSSVYDKLSHMYSALHEEDLWAGLWLKHAKYPETNVAIAYEQMGFFEEAQSTYDSAMTKFKQEVANGPASSDMVSELLLWDYHWIRCAKELNQWDILLDYAQSSKEKNSFLIMESAWRVPDWTLMKQALVKVEQTCPKQYKVNLYRGYLAILNQEDQHLSNVERCVEAASLLCMKEWRRLPHIVSNIHLPILQVSQQIMELQEASQIHQGLQCRNTSMHDLKATVKTWRNRLPVIADDLSHWSDIFTWRQHHYQIITTHLEQQPDASSQAMLGVHASAQAIIHFGKIARKHNLTSVCQDTLSRIYTIPSVPIVDCFQKIRQQVKCYLQMAAVSGRSELNEALEVIESTNLKYFSKEMTAEFYAMKGLLLAQIGRSDDANKAFSAAAQLHESLIKAWALWGDYLEHIFTTRTPRQMNLGVSAIVCFLHACRHTNESKARKYLAKILWLLSYDDEKSQLMEAIEKYAIGVPPVQWVPWIPQLLCCLVQYQGIVILNLLTQVGRMYPQAVYFSIRTLYLMLKIEQRERYKSAEMQANKTQQASQQTSQQGLSQSDVAGECSSQGSQQQGGATPGVSTAGTSSQSDGTTTTGQPTTGQAPIKATPPMWRCSKIMHIQRDIHPTILSSLEGIVDQMVWFRENWYEEVLRQLRQGLAKCYVIAFENRGSVSEATITPHTLNFVKKLVATFGIGIENLSSSVATQLSSTEKTNQQFSSAASESLARRAQTTFQDPVFQKMKEQFANNFDFSQPGALKLHNLISKLKTWIKILEGKTKHFPKSFLIEEKCRFLSNFSQKQAEVELPGEQLVGRQTHYSIRIARFMPRVEIVQKHNTAARRLYIRGTNGKIYPYLVVNDSGLGDARREERVLQLLRMMNLYLGKQKETSRRFLHITVPRVAAVSPQMRLVEDNPASISLLDIYKIGCAKSQIDHDTPISRYYEKLGEVQARGSQTTHTVLREILREVQTTMVPKTMLKEWAAGNFRSATDYWQFRKMFTLQLSLACLSEYSLHLTRLNSEMMYVHQDSGLINISYFKFDVDDTTGELDVNRPVPFRLTPNIVEYLSTIGISGPLTTSAIATARCLVQPNFKLRSILRAILRDEIFAVHKKRILDEKPIDINMDLTQEKGLVEIDMEKIILVVNKAVAGIVSRLETISCFENMETNKMSTLVQAAQNPDNLCRMDPAWHPWL